IQPFPSQRSCHTSGRFVCLKTPPPGTDHTLDFSFFSRNVHHARWCVCPLFRQSVFHPEDLASRPVCPVPHGLEIAASDIPSSFRFSTKRRFFRFCCRNSIVCLGSWTVRRKSFLSTMEAAMTGRISCGLMPKSIAAIG